MQPDPTPTELGRQRALQAIAERADLLADQQPADRSGLAEDDRAYLRAYCDTCRSVAQRLRCSMGVRG